MTRMKWVSLKIERNSIWYLIISLLDVRDYLILLFILIIGFFFRGFRGRFGVLSTTNGLWSGLPGKRLFFCYLYDSSLILLLHYTLLRYPYIQLNLFTPTIFSSLEFLKYVDLIKRVPCNILIQLILKVSHTSKVWSELSEKENLSTKDFLSSIAISIPVSILLSISTIILPSIDR